MKRMSVRPRSKVIEIMPESREKEKASNLALLAMTRLFLEKKICHHSGPHPLFVRVMEEFLLKGISNAEEILPYIQRIESFLSASMEDNTQ